MKIAGKTNDSIVDGEGLRLVVFTQGCLHNCKACHNPETHDPNAGEEISLDELFDWMRRDRLAKGLTISGGEPFLQAQDAATLAKEAKQLGLDVWVYTGYTYEQLIKADRDDWNALLAETDVLVDGLYIDEEKCYDLLFRGSRNQRLIDVPKSKKEGKAMQWTSKATGDLSHFSVPES